MADKWFEMDVSQAEKIQKNMAAFGTGAGHVIDDVLHGKGADLIKTRITPLIPRSGRKWSGKSKAAADAMPRAFSQDNDQLAVTIAARGKYHYLYFPDDGSNTVSHQGGKEFMKKGAEKASDEVIELCVQKLIENFNGGN